LKDEKMNLNHLAISLIEIDPENISELDEFKKNLVLFKDEAKGHLKDVLDKAFAEVEAWSGQDPESRRAGIVRLGELLEQAMEFSEEDPSGGKPEKHLAVATETATARNFTLSSDFDSDLMNEFIIENMELANMAESAILDWEKDPGNQELLNTIFRAFHTIKGTSSFLNLDCVKDIAHHSESMLALVRDGQDNFTRDHADLAFKSLDMVKIILERMKLSGPGMQIELPWGHEELLEDLKNFISGSRKSKVDDRPAAPVNERRINERRSNERRSRKEGEASADNFQAGSQTPDQVVESSVRVKIGRLDKLLDTVGELVIAQTMVGQDEMIVGGKNHELNKKISQAGKIVRELHDLSLILRMVPLKGTFQKMARLARDLSQKNGKKVNFITEGDEVEIDRNMVDMVADPLVHLIRNAIDHGIETPDERSRIGKSESASIYLTASHAEGSIMLTVWDDGRGLNRQKIVVKAIARGLIDSAERMTDQEVWQMIFQPGFSTAEKVTEVSGRGVGLDVVSQTVEALRGRIEIQSSEGQGCAFILRMPLTMAITDGMVIKVGSQRYILPTANIQKAVRPEESDIHTVNERAEMLSFRDELLPVIRLHKLFNIPDAQTQLTSGLLVVIVEGQHRCALFVDNLLSQTQVVTKLLGKGLNNVPGVAGGAIMGDGTVGLILDAAGIISISQQRVNITT
jgi:two-component system, chemotaxis family, sensor kinase CheA